MATEIDLWQTAWIIAEQYGGEGVAFAAEMARSFDICGKIEAYDAWLSITQKVELLTATAARHGTLAG